MIRARAALLAIAATHMGSMGCSGANEIIAYPYSAEPEVYLGPDDRQQWNRNPAMYTPTHSQKIKGKLRRRHR